MRPFTPLVEFALVILACLTIAASPTSVSHCQRKTKPTPHSAEPVPPPPAPAVDPPKSAQASSAIKNEETSISHADDACRQAAISAMEACVKDLDATLKGVTQGGNLEEANRVSALKKSITSDIEQLTNDPRSAVSDSTTGDPPKTTRAAEALKRKDAAVKRAADTRSAAIVAAKRRCVQELLAAIKASTIGGDLDEANRITAFKKQLETEISAEAVAAPSRSRKYDAELYASGDDSFVLYINGELVCQGETKVVQHHVKIGPGDTITVRAINRAHEHGFACYIAFTEQKKSIITHTSTWKIYTPKDALTWYDPAGITNVKPAQTGQDKYIRVEFEKVLQGDQEALWGPQKVGTVYLTLSVTDLVLRDMKATFPAKK